MNNAHMCMYVKRCRSKIDQCNVAKQMQHLSKHQTCWSFINAVLPHKCTLSKHQTQVLNLRRAHEYSYLNKSVMVRPYSLAHASERCSGMCWRTRPRNAPWARANEVRNVDPGSVATNKLEMSQGCLWWTMRGSNRRRRNVAELLSGTCPRTKAKYMK